MKGYIISTLITTMLNIIFMAWVISDKKYVSRRARVVGIIIILILAVMAVIGIQLLTKQI